MKAVLLLLMMMMKLMRTVIVCSGDDGETVNSRSVAVDEEDDYEKG